MRPFNVFSMPAAGLNGHFAIPGPLCSTGKVVEKKISVSSDPAVEHRHRFKRWNPVDEAQGFDQGAIGKPQSQIIPAGDSCMVDLRWGENAESIFLDRPIAKITDCKASTGLKMRLTIEGIAPGDPNDSPCFLHAVNDHKKCWSALEIVVRKIRKVPIAFHFISDTRHEVRRNPSERANLVKRINQIFRPQTCITFIDVTPGASVVSKKRSVDLGDKIETGDIKVRREMAEVVTEAGTFGIPINIFCVWDLKSNPGERVGGEMRQNGYCFFSDLAKKDPGKQLAHEMGHFLTWNDMLALYDSEEGHWGEFGTAGKLMTNTANGIVISREEADVMFATASNLPGVR